MYTYITLMQPNTCNCTSFWYSGSLSHAQGGHTALLMAAHGGSVEMARMLLDECGSTVNEVNNVSMEPVRY